jgi:mannosyltransferase OCH1-like enzyme
MKLTKIPRNIFQTWETKDISEDFLTLTQTWKKMNPNYAYFLYDDNDCVSFIKKHYDYRFNHKDENGSKRVPF